MQARSSFSDGVKMIVVAFLLTAGSRVVIAQEKGVAPASAAVRKPQFEDGTRAADEFLKLIPANGWGAVVPSQDRSAKRGDIVAKETGAIPFFTPSALLSMLRQGLGAKEVDTSGPIAVSSLRIEGNARPIASFYSRDVKATLKGYGLKSADVGDDGIAMFKGGLGWAAPREFGHIHLRDKLLRFCEKQADLKEMLEEKSLFEALTKEQRAEWCDVDILFHGSIRAVADDDRRSAGEGLADFFREDKATAKQAMTVAEHLQSIFASITFADTEKPDEMFMLTKLKLALDGNAEASQALRELAGEGTSDLVGLPDGNLIAATAIHGTSRGSALATDGLFSAPFWPWSRLVSNTRTSFLGALFKELATEIDNTAIGVYANKADSERGLASVVVVLTPQGTPEELITKMRSLSTFINSRAAREMRVGDVSFDAEEVAKLIRQLEDDDFVKREDAMAALRRIGPPVLPELKKAMESDSELIAARSRRLYDQIYGQVGRTAANALEGDVFAKLNPKFVFRKNSGKPDRPIAEIVLKPGKQTTALNEQMSAVFGQNWNRIRFAIMDKHVVMLFGSETDWLDRAVQTVSDAAEPISKKAKIAAARRRMNGQRLGEWHFSMPRLIALTSGRLQMPSEPPQEFSSLLITRSPHAVRAELTIPASGLKAIGAANARR